MNEKPRHELAGSSALTIGIIERYLAQKLRMEIGRKLEGALRAAIDEVVNGITLRWMDGCLEVHVTLANPELVEKQSL